MLEFWSAKILNSYIEARIYNFYRHINNPLSTDIRLPLGPDEQQGILCYQWQKTIPYRPPLQALDFLYLDYKNPQAFALSMPSSGAIDRINCRLASGNRNRPRRTMHPRFNTAG